MGFESFEDLEVYKEARKFRRSMSALCKKLPPEEKFRLVDQIQRASRSVTNHIAEGYGRYHYQEYVQYCRMSRGSLEETHDHLTICLDEGYINQEEYDRYYEQKTLVRKLLNGFINYLKRRGGKSS